MVQLTIEGKTIEVTDEEFEKLFELQYKINNKFLPREERKIAKARLAAYMKLLKESKVVDE